MIEVKCGKCGKVFEAEASDQSRTVKCPNCNEGVFVPAMLGGIEEHSLPPMPPPTPPRHVLRPVELALIAVVGCAVVFVVLFKLFSKEPRQVVVRPPTSEVEEEVKKEKNQAEKCKSGLSRLAAVLSDYTKKKGALPQSLEELVEGGLIEAESLSCNKGRYIYLVEEASTAPSADEAILVCDCVAAAHLGHRNVITLRFEVREFNEDVVSERLKRQSEALKQKKAKEVEEAAKAKQRDAEASRKWGDAQQYYTKNDLKAALEVLKTLSENYADTPFVKEKREEIERLTEEIKGKVRLNEVREYVQKRDFEESLKRYDELSSEVKWLKDVIEKDKRLLERFRKSLWFKVDVGNLESAQAALMELAKDTEDPFWRGLIESEMNSIKVYEEQGTALLAASEAASQKGDHQRALALLHQLRWEFPRSKAAKRFDELVSGISKNAPLAERFADKNKMMERNKDATAAIDAALAYLAAQQNPDGYWVPEVSGQTAIEKEGLTAFLLLPFIAEGNTHITGAHRGIVRKALTFLLKSQSEDGAICGVSENSLYSHSFALLALAELYGTTKDPALREPLLKASNYALSRKEPASGWKKSKGQVDEDAVLTAWMMLALSAAAAYEGSIVPSKFTNGLAVFERRMDSEGRIEYVKPKDAVVEKVTEEYQVMLAKTAAAAFARVIHYERLTDSETGKALSLFGENLPDAAVGGRITPKSSNLIFWFFTLHLYYQVGALRFSGWWHPAKKAILALQITEGNKRGAWDASLVWVGVRGGSLFDTALAVLSLQARYMHFGGLNLPATEKLPGKPVVITLNDDTIIEGYLIKEKETKDEIVVMQKRGESTIERSVKKSDVKSIEEKE